MGNMVCLTKKEAEEYQLLQTADVVGKYGKDTVERIERKLKEQTDALIWRE